MVESGTYHRWRWIGWIEKQIGGWGIGIGGLESYWKIIIFNNTIF
jgi:hypothetical protein